jgi:hypothetical protein
VIPVGSQHSLTTPLPFRPLAPKPTHLLSSPRHTNKSSIPFISSHFVVSILHIQKISVFFSFQVTSSSEHSLLHGYGCAVRGESCIPHMLNMRNVIMFMYKYVSCNTNLFLSHALKNIKFKTVMMMMMIIIFVWTQSIIIQFNSMGIY